MIGQNNNTTILSVIDKLAKAKNEELVSIVKEVCQLDENSLKKVIVLIGDLNFKGLIEYNTDILMFCLEQKKYKCFETIFIETDLSKEVIAKLFLNSVPPLEIALLLNHLDTRDRFLNAVKLNNIEGLKEIIHSEKLVNYPNMHRLIEKALLQIFITRSEEMPILNFLVGEKMLKEYQHYILKKSLNLALFQKKHATVKKIIMDWDIEKETEVELILQMDKDQVAIGLFNTRELQKSLSQKLAKKPLNKKDEIIKI